MAIGWWESQVIKWSNDKETLLALDDWQRNFIENMTRRDWSRPLTQPQLDGLKRINNYLVGRR